jgi:hypothetical protein
MQKGTNCNTDIAVNKDTTMALNVDCHVTDETIVQLKR